MTSIVVFDLEYTAWPGSNERAWSEEWEEPEIIQIGAVRLTDDANMEESGTLDLLVKPEINPRLSDYITALTGISQEQLDEHGVSLINALTTFVEFLSEATYACCYGADNEYMAHNCRIRSLAFPLTEFEFVNVRPPILDHLGPGKAQTTSGELPGAMGFRAMGDAHNALGDSRSIAEALRIMRRAGTF